MLMVEDNVRNQFRPNAIQNVGNQYRNGNVVTAPAEGNGNGINDCSKEKQGIQLTSEEFDFIAARCLRISLEEQYTELLEPIPEPHQVQQNDSNVISEVSSVEQFGGTVEQHPVTVEETRAYFESLYNNLATEVEKVNLVNRKMKETNAELTTELASPVYQEQCLTKKINALHLSSEAAKFVRDFKSLAKEADESLAKHKALELEIEHLLRAVVHWKFYSVICSMNNSNGENHVVSKSSDVTTADAFDKRQQQQDSTSSTSSLATTISADGNFDL
ncbi:hypothetical protein Tco_0173875 [Tanacetum coccineum]